MSGSSYNAVSWLLDRNVDEGRGTKLAFTDTVSDLTYRGLQQQSCRVANLLRRLGVRREERVAMIMLDTVDFPAVFLGAIRAGVVRCRQTRFDLGSVCHVLRTAAPGAVHLRSAAACRVKDMVGRIRISSMSSSGQDAHGHKKLSDDSRAESDSFATVATIPTSRRSGCFVGFDRHAKGVRHLHSNLAATAETYQTRCSASARTMCACRRQNCSCLWPRQRDDLSDVGRRHHRAQFGAADAGVDVRADGQINRRSSTACRRCSRRC